MHTRKRTTLLGLVTVLALVSFALSVWAVGRYPSAAFYLAPYRTWELMLGAILALGEFPVPKFALGLRCAFAGRVRRQSVGPFSRSRLQRRSRDSMHSFPVWARRA